MQTLITIDSGLTYDLLTGKFSGSPPSFTASTLAWALAGLPRFLGHGQPSAQISVAAHSLLVSDMLVNYLRIPRRGVQALSPALVGLEGLLHDAREALTGDIVRPLKNALSIEAQTELRVIEERAHDAICASLDLLVPVPAVPRDLVIRADDVALLLEQERRFPYHHMSKEARDFLLHHDELARWGRTSPFLSQNTLENRSRVALEFEVQLAALGSRAYYDLYPSIDD